MNLNKFRRYVIHKWDAGDGVCCERVHHSCFRGIKDNFLKWFYRDNNILSYYSVGGGQYEEFEKVKRTDKKVRHRNR